MSALRACFEIVAADVRRRIFLLKSPEVSACSRRRLPALRILKQALRVTPGVWCPPDPQSRARLQGRHRMGAGGQAETPPADTDLACSRARLCEDAEHATAWRPSSCYRQNEDRWRDAFLATRHRGSPTSCDGYRHLPTATDGQRRHTKNDDAVKTILPTRPNSSYIELYRANSTLKI